MAKKKEYPPGMKKFMDELESKTIFPGTAMAYTHCDICEKKIKLVPEMNVFVYPDAPYHTTKKLCLKCLMEEKMKQDVTYNN